MSAIGHTGAKSYRAAAAELTVDQRAEQIVRAGQGKQAGVQGAYDFWVYQESATRGANRAHFRAVREALARRSYTVEI